MRIVYQGQYTEKDFRNAIALHLQAPRRLAVIIFVALIVLVLLSIGATGDLMSDLGAAAPFLILAILFLYPLLLPWWQASKMRDSPLLKSPIQGEITDKTLSWSGKGFDTELAWEDVTAHRMSADLILLYQESGMFTPLPEHLFADDADWQRLVTYVEQHIPVKSDRKTKVLLGAVAVAVIAVTLFSIYTTLFL